MPLTTSLSNNLTSSLMDAPAGREDKLYETTNASENDKQLYNMEATLLGENDKLSNFSLPVPASTTKFYDMSPANRVFDMSPTSSKFHEMSSANSAIKLYDMNTFQHSANSLYEMSVSDLPTSKLYDIGLINDKSVAASACNYGNCAKATSCGYDTYSQASMYQTSTLQGQRSSYTMIPQAGYTSVIVDPQQYHVSNGYAVH